MQLPRKKAIIYNNDVHLIWMQYYTIKMFTSYDGNNIIAFIWGKHHNCMLLPSYKVNIIS
jgi:hypothetical protein